MVSTPRSSTMIKMMFGGLSWAESEFENRIPPKTKNKKWNIKGFDFMVGNEVYNRTYGIKKVLCSRDNCIGAIENKKKKEKTV